MIKTACIFLRTGNFPSFLRPKIILRGAKKDSRSLSLSELAFVPISFSPIPEIVRAYHPSPHPLISLILFIFPSDIPFLPVDGFPIWSCLSPYTFIIRKCIACFRRTELAGIFANQILPLKIVDTFYCK